MIHAYETAVAHLSDMPVKKVKEVAEKSALKGTDLELFNIGKAIYAKEGYCTTCHQADGKGLTASGFPPLAGTPWVVGNEERAIKIVLKGLLGPIEVNGKKYPGQVPMTPFEGLLNDKEVAAVLTYVRNSFGNKAPAIQANKVKAVRAALKNQKDIYNASKLLAEHPLEK